MNPNSGMVLARPGLGLLLCAACCHTFWTDAAAERAAAQASPHTSPAAVSPAATGPERLKTQDRITVATNAPSVSDSSPEEKSFQWKASWAGWDGIHYELARKTLINDPLATVLETIPGTSERQLLQLEQIKMTGKIGAKLAIDAAGYITGKEFHDFDGGVEARRARIYAQGDCLLLLPVSYQLEIGYIPNEFYIEESYLKFKPLPWIGELRIGQYQAPMGLEVVSSTRDITFMEPAAPMQALAPGVNAGIQIGRPVFDQRATWALGIFTDGVGKDYGEATKEFGRVITRITALPIYNPDPDQPGSAQLLHVGLSGNVLYSGNSTVRYQARPESHLAPYVVDTGDIPSDGAMVVGGEVAWIDGPFSIQGEFLHSFVRQFEAPPLNFNGLYGSVGWFLTGETRPYNRAEGMLARVIPKHNFDWGHGGWGAWETVARASYVSLDSAEVHGGRLAMLMAGLNWYMHSHVKWRFDYGFGHVYDHQPEGNINIFQTRLEIDL